ncbi:IclR family transcriptional regulator [Neobacillus mesonae]|uniref:IclR family transcriptional regulator n=1 Tax=Neobacillus mesonae TaxID=1193713 RepID=UPI002E1EE762|nr:IclR family transcriptional regulator [Neobacillus mesonae]
MTNESNFIPSVNSALRVLEFLSNEQTQSCSLSEISKALSINKSTCLRILKTMQRKEFVNYHDETKRYKLGSYLISLGTRAKEVNDYISVAISHLSTICHEIGQTVVLAKQTDPYNMIYIGKEEPNQKIRLTVATGENFPIIGGATGKAYLAHLPDEKIKQIIDEFTVDGKLPKYTENTITDPSIFLDSLKSIVQEGISVTDSEHTLGIYAISCPIFNSRNEVVLSIGVFIQSTASQFLDIQSIKKSIKHHAKTISNKISRYI